MMKSNFMRKIFSITLIACLTITTPAFAVEEAAGSVQNDGIEGVENVSAVDENYDETESTDVSQNVEETSEVNTAENDADNFETVSTENIESELVDEMSDVSTEDVDEVYEDIVINEETVTEESVEVIDEEETVEEKTEEVDEVVEDTDTEDVDGTCEETTEEFVDLDEEIEDKIDEDCAEVADIIDISVTEYGAIPNDGKDDTNAFRNAAIEVGDKGNGSIMRIPAGTYNISGYIPVYSNMKIIADSGAVIKRTQNSDEKILLMAEITTSGSGYDVIQNFEISGGTWNANSSATEDTVVFHFGHGKNINIHDLTVSGSTNHMINVSSSKNVTIKNVKFTNMVKYTKNDNNFWGSFSVGDPERYKFIEAIHLDYAGPGESFGNADGTVPDTVTITGCTFDGVLTGIGTHRENSPKGKNITITGNSFKKVLYGPCLLPIAMRI